MHVCIKSLCNIMSLSEKNALYLFLENASEIDEKCISFVSTYIKRLYEFKIHHRLTHGKLDKSILQEVSKMS